MKPQEKSDLFKKELLDLLSKYGAEIVIEDVGVVDEENVLVAYFKYDVEMFLEHGVGIAPKIEFGNYI